MTSFDHQCDALTESGKRCTKRCKIVIPNTLGQEPGPLGKWITGREVHLCRTHDHLYLDRKQADRSFRLPLIEKGYLGSGNRHGFGFVVNDTPVVEWDTTKKLRVPKYWYFPDGVSY